MIDVKVINHYGDEVHKVYSIKLTQSPNHAKRTSWPLRTRTNHELQAENEDQATNCAKIVATADADVQLAELLAAWPNLTDDVRAALLAIVRGELRRASEYEIVGGGR